MPTPNESLFQQVVNACGLAPAIGPSAVKRACSQVGVDAEKLTVADLPKVKASLAEALSLFLPADKAAAAIKRISALG